MINPEKQQVEIMSRIFDENEIHKTTMTHEQRCTLIRTLSVSNPIEELARLNDNELHLQWLAECEYIDPKRAPIQ